MFCCVCVCVFCSSWSFPGKPDPGLLPLLDGGSHVTTHRVAIFSYGHWRCLEGEARHCKGFHLGLCLCAAIVSFVTFASNTPTIALANSVTQTGGGHEPTRSLISGAGTVNHAKGRFLCFISMCFLAPWSF